MDLPVFNLDQFNTFLLVLTRISILVFLAPVFGSDLVPAHVKVALALVMTLILTPTVRVDPTVFPQDTIGFVPLLLGEAFLGLTLSLILRLVLEGVQLAGQFIGYQMGFSIVNVMDPQTGAQSSVISELAYIVALVVFLGINGHHLVIKALVQSFDLVPPGRFLTTPLVMSEMSKAVGELFVIAVKIGAPVLSILFFAQVSMGIVAKAVPQMNILFVGMPMYIIIGLFIFGLSLTFFPTIIGRSVVWMDETILHVLTTR